MSREPGRARKRLLVGGAVLTAASLGAAAGFAAHEDQPPVSRPAVTATASVTRQNLVETTTVSGTLRYASERRVLARRAGTVTRLAAEGSTVRSGHALYAIDNQPVTLFAGTVPAYRRLAPGSEGPDVRQLEKGLRALGYDGFTVDEKYTENTAAAVREWQEDIGVDTTGVVELGSVIFGPRAVRIGSHGVAVGDPISPGATVMTRTSKRRIVAVDLEVDQQGLVHKGATVKVELPDGRQVNGRVTRLGTVAKTGQQDGQGEATTGGDTDAADPTIEVEMALAPSARIGRFDQAPVEVELETGRRNSVLTVPVTALLARADGGYRVRVVDGPVVRTVRVRIGMFAGGRVEVSGDGLRPGTKVEVPAS